MIKEINTSIPNFLDDEQLKVNLELNLLVRASLCPSEDLTQKKLVKLNTGIVYKQQKYNLLREESEGFSKLVTELLSFPSSQEQHEAHVKHVLSVIGQFELDPNRVIDLILDGYERHSWNVSFVALLRHFRSKNVLPTLGLRLMNHQEKHWISDLKEKETQKEKLVVPVKVEESEKPPSTSSSSLANSASKAPANANVTPAGLYAVTANLLANDSFKLSELLPYLHPSVEEMASASKLAERDMQRSIREYKVVSLTSLAPSSGTSTGSTASGNNGLSFPSSNAPVGNVNTVTQGGTFRPPPPSIPLPPTAAGGFASFAANALNPPPPLHPPNPVNRVRWVALFDCVLNYFANAVSHYRVRFLRRAIWFLEMYNRLRKTLREHAMLIRHVMMKMLLQRNSSIRIESRKKSLQLQFLHHPQRQEQ